MYGEHEVDCLAAQTLINEGYGSQNADEDQASTENKEAQAQRGGNRMSELDIAYAVSSPFGAGIETVSA